MNVLLFSMPDVVPMFTPTQWRPPHLGCASLAANTTDHDVFCADLIVKRETVGPSVREAMERVKPRFVGFSAMSFQFDTAVRVAELVRQIDPSVPTVLGGYHATLMYEDIFRSERASSAFDYLIRGEGETAFNLLVHAVAGEEEFEKVPGLCWKQDGKWRVNERGGLEDLTRIRIPKRSARVWGGYFFRGVRREGLWKVLTTGSTREPLDVVESSRGCTMPCNFCSMGHMYGRTFRCYELDRVMEDIADCKARGARWIIFADDNITLDVKRYEELCDAILRAGHDDVSYIIQASSAGISSSERLVRKMDRAGFRIVFLGIENVSERNLRALKKGNIVEKTKLAVQYLHKYRILIVGGLIIGSPDDTEADIEENYRFFERHNVDYFADQIATPYPRTPLREELLGAGLVVNPDDFRWYNGFWANVRTKHLSPDDIQFLRWKFGRKYSTFARSTPTLRSAFPVYTIARALWVRPLRSVKSWVRHWNKTEADLYREDMERYLGWNDFFEEGEQRKLSAQKGRYWPLGHGGPSGRNDE